ncbi:hypothetical protein GDO81_018437, partial [Engystomops pustulosus]
CGKSLLEWLSDRRERKLLKKDIDLHRRIKLIQDIEMPTVCTSLRISRDGRYILTTGTCRPRVRCYDTYHLSMKLERCMDSEVVTFEILSEDSKLLFLHNDRYIEFHSQHGYYFKFRIPKFGRDFSYLSQAVTCTLLEPLPDSLQTEASLINVYDINPDHHLFAAGSVEGKVECWDPRIRSRVGILDYAMGCVSEDTEINGLPAVTALKFNGPLHMAVGTSTGQVLLYDLRSSRMLTVKDHQYGLPIKSIQFHDPMELIISADSRIIKMWNTDNGKVLTFIEPPSAVNEMCLYPNSGMLFTGNEASKMNVYYVPALGPAPKWCSFLDNVTEELEENPESTVYDDYKFVTKRELEDLGLTHLIGELEDLGLTHLIGSAMLRAYMHGYFIDIRLYHKAKYYLMFGRHGHLPADMTWDMESPDSQSLLPQTDWVHEHQRRLADAREVVDLRLEEAREKQKRDFDRNACAEPLAPGDRVWLRNNHPTSKLDGHWEHEPYLVRDSLSPEVYEISRGDRPLLRVHRNRLKRCLRPFAPMSRPLTSTPNLKSSLCSPTPLELVTVPQLCVVVSTPVSGTPERPSSPPQSPILLPVEDDPAP